MKIVPTSLEGVCQVLLEPRADHRGYLARTFCADTFASHGLNTQWRQCNQTLTRQTGALRGLHWQAEPEPEIKLVRCLSGRVWDVVVDVRPDSPAFGRWEAFELSAANQTGLYIPVGYAHGFQCLETDCTLFYMMSAAYVPELARGLRWDDPSVRIPWPLEVTDLSQRDQALPLLHDIR